MRVPSLLTTLAVAATLLSSAVGFTLTGHIPPSTALPNPALLPPTTTITLSSAFSHHKTLLRRDTTFRFRDVPAGSYLLETVSPTYHFSPLRVDVEKDGQVRVYQTFRGNPWANMGPQVSGLVVTPVKQKEYFVVQEGFSPMRMLLANPIVLVALFSLGLIIGLPKIVDKLDPEFKKELEQSRRGGMTNPGAITANAAANFDLAGYLSGASSNAGSGGNAGKQAKGNKKR